MLLFSFIQRKEQQYILRAYVVGEVLNSFVDTTGSQTSDNVQQYTILHTVKPLYYTQWNHYTTHSETCL